MFDRVYLIKSKSAVTNYNSSFCFSINKTEWIAYIALMIAFQVIYGFFCWFIINYMIATKYTYLWVIGVIVVSWSPIIMQLCCKFWSSCLIHILFYKILSHWHYWQLLPGPMVNWHWRTPGRRLRTPLPTLLAPTYRGQRPRDVNQSHWKPYMKMGFLDRQIDPKLK